MSFELPVMILFFLVYDLLFQILYSSLSASASEWQTLDVLARRIYIVPVYSLDADIVPTIMITACKYCKCVEFYRTLVRNSF